MDRLIGITCTIILLTILVAEGKLLTYLSENMSMGAYLLLCAILLYGLFYIAKLIDDQERQ